MTWSAAEALNTAAWKRGGSWGVSVKMTNTLRVLRQV